MTEKKNPDYTASAVNITNPVEIEILLGQRKAIGEQVADARKLLEVTDAFQLVKKGEVALAVIDKGLIALIDEKGGYQDTDAGLYALRQRRVSLSYNPERLMECIPQWAGAVTKQVVDPKQVSQLLKTSLITQAQIEKATIKKETTRVIIES